MYICSDKLPNRKAHEDELAVKKMQRMDAELKSGKKKSIEFSGCEKAVPKGI